jgi:CheY-like chemotaxis protein
MGTGTESFELRSACNELTKELNSLVDKTNLLRFSVDIQLPDKLNGELQSLSRSIRKVTTYLSQTLVNGIIEIELFMHGLSGSTVSVRVSICGQGLWRPHPELLGGLHRHFADAGLSVLTKEEKEELCYEWVTHFSVLEKAPIRDDLAFPGTKILLAEDNEINAMVFSTFLEEWGCDTTLAVNGAEAVSLAHEKPFDLILMDIYMPILNGTLATKKIREFSEIPIIALTASTQESDTREAIEAGANNFLLKPVSSTQLFQTLSKWL